MLTILHHIQRVNCKTFHHLTIITFAAYNVGPIHHPRVHFTALEKLPDDAHILIRRAEVRGHMGEKVKAVADYKRAIDLQSMQKVQV